MSYRPLADILRPQKLEEVFGQEHLLSADSLMPRSIAESRPTSLVFWGPPGTGKTTLARLYAKAFGAEFVQLSAVLCGVADVRKVVAKAQEQRAENPESITVLFVDEIHRFNKAQQDAFLPYVEDGTLILIGATTENPSFSLNNALLSRVQVLTLKSLSDAACEKLIERAQSYLEKPLKMTADAKSYLVKLSQGDGRYLLGLIESLAQGHNDEELDIERIENRLEKRVALYDKDGDGHYDLISALHKSIRGSDPDAALYWFNRMLTGGEDPLYLCRRLIRMAVEDVGLADPQALTQAMAARDAYQMLGTPEGELAIAQVVVYLALAPKSNGVYKAYKLAKVSADKTGHLKPPAHILNAPTKLMSNLGYGKNYKYDHDEVAGFSGQNYFPDGMKRESYYQPVERGFEREMVKRLVYFEKLRKEKSST